jgi:hypothetical protein
MSPGPSEDLPGGQVPDAVLLGPVATVSRKWFRIADMYWVGIAPDQESVVVSAATFALDMMAQEGR